MIDVVDSNSVYYYHRDGLGSVVALSDSAGDTVQTYEYSVYGQVAASDPNFLTNPYLFTGRRFDLETGLYYYRARYYNPYIGRFLQTDPVGYDDGMNWYAYCGNNPVGRADPSGLAVDWFWYGSFRFLDNVKKLTFQYLNASGEKVTEDFDSFDQWETWAQVYFNGREDEMAGSTLAGNDSELFWELQKMAFLSRGVGNMLWSIDRLMETTEQKVTIVDAKEGGDKYFYGTNTLRWNSDNRGPVDYFPGPGVERKWHTAPAMVGLAHELQHLWDDLQSIPYVEEFSEVTAMRMENNMRYSLFKKAPNNKGIYPRPGYDRKEKDLGWTASGAWSKYRKNMPMYPRHKIPK